MANFEGWVKKGTRRYRRIEAGWTDKPDWDKGHWTGGAVGSGTKVGTNMSISAFVYQEYLNSKFPIIRVPLTPAVMKAMPREHALEIYKTKYWDKVRGDEIDSQLIANFVADMKSSGGGVRNFQKALVELGENISIDGSFGPQTLAATNRLLAEGREAELNNAFRRHQIAYYKSLPNQAQNWYDSLNRDYPELYTVSTPFGNKSASKFDAIKFLLIFLIVSLVGFWGYRTFVKKK